MAVFIPEVDVRALARSLWQRKWLWLGVTVAGGLAGLMLSIAEGKLPAQAVLHYQTGLSFEGDREIERTNEILSMLFDDPQFLTAVARRLGPVPASGAAAQLQQIRDQVSLKLSGYGVLKLHVQAEAEAKALALAEAVSVEFQEAHQRIFESTNRLRWKLAEERKSELLREVQQKVQDLQASGIEPLDPRAQAEALYRERLALRKEIAKSVTGSDQEKKLAELLGTVEATLGRLNANSSELLALDQLRTAARDATETFERELLESSKDRTFFVPIYGPEIWSPRPPVSLRKSLVLSLMASAAIATIGCLLLSAADLSQRNSDDR